MSLIARLGVVLGLNSSEFIKGLDDATKKTKEFEYNQRKQLKLAKQATDDLMANISRAAIGLAAFGYALATTFSKADEISDTAKAFDMTVESLLAAKSALQASGGEAENFTTMLSKLASAQEGAQDGAEAMRDAFKKLGISGKDVDSLGLEDMFKRVAFELSKVEDTTKRTALAQDILGKAAKGVDWKSFADEYSRIADPGLAKAIEDNAAAWGNIEKAMKNISMLVQQMVQPFAILVNHAFDLVNVWKHVSQGGGTEIDFGAALGGMPGEEGAIVGNYYAAPKNKKIEPLKISTPSSGEYKKKTASETSAIDKAAEKRKKEAEKAKELEQDFQEMLAKAYDRQAKFNAQLKEMTEIQKANESLMANEFLNQKELLQLESERHLISENEYNTRKLNIEQAQRLKDIEERAREAKIIALAEFEKTDAADQVRAKAIYDKKVEYIDSNLENQRIYFEKINEMEDANLQKSIERQKSWSAGWDEALKQYTEAAARASDRGAAAFQSVVSNMEGALRRFVDTGKFSFGELVGSIIKDLAYMELRAQASAIFSMLWGSISSSFGGGGANPSANLIMSGVGKKASGGRIDSPTIVGENGAELFVPQTSGTVIPNGSWQQMAAAGNNSGGITVNGNYIASMSAIDTQSATQFLAANKNAIWASYQSANRSVPISR
jgi:lambda family phage tail tape measure protein